MAQADRPSWHPADPFPGVSFPRCHGLGRRRQGLGRPWGKGGDKAKGKGKGGRAKGHRDMGFTNEQKVWIGGIPENATFKELFELLKPAGAEGGPTSLSSCTCEAACSHRNVRFTAL
uniref:RRM domain-containing protein n=1 Tax=Alexandrium monilatum TaxID=311494 RepID=A0A6T1MGS2_9DINO